MKKTLLWILIIVVVIGLGYLIYSYWDELQASDTSSAAVQLSSTPSITVISPNGGETLQAGGFYTVKWSSNNMATSSGVKIALYRYNIDRVASLIASTTNDGEQRIVVPRVSSGSQYRMMVVSATNQRIGDMSNANFTIFASSTPTATSTPPIVINQFASQQLVDNGQSAPTKSLVSFSYVLHNLSSNNIFVSKDPSKAIVIAVSGNASTSGTVMAVTPSGLLGDMGPGYIIPAGGSRSFTFQTLVSNTGNPVANVITRVVAIRYGTAAFAPDTLNVTAGLDALKVSGQVY